MSIDNIQLPAFLQKALFNNKLVSPQAKAAVKTSQQKKVTIDFLGGNSKNIAFVVNSNDSKYVNDDQLKFVSGLAKACNISLDDIAIVNIAQQKSISYMHLAEQLSCRKIFSFGVAPSDLNLPFTIPFFQLQAFQEIDYIFCPSLKKLQEDTQAKKQLWASLQKTFKIN